MGSPLRSSPSILIEYNTLTRYPSQESQLPQLPQGTSAPIDQPPSQMSYYVYLSNGSRRPSLPDAASVSLRFFISRYRGLSGQNGKIKRKTPAGKALKANNQFQDSQDPENKNKK